MGVKLIIRHVGESLTLIHVHCVRRPARIWPHVVLSSFQSIHDLKEFASTPVNLTNGRAWKERSERHFLTPLLVIPRIWGIPGTSSSTHSQSIIVEHPSHAFAQNRSKRTERCKNHYSMIVFEQPSNTLLRFLLFKRSAHSAGPTSETPNPESQTLG